MTPTTRDPSNRREQIVVAAAELLCTGDGKLTHRKVAEHAGVPLGSTTYYFASLDDLVAAALQALAERVEADLAESAELLAASDGTPESVARLFHDYLTDGDRVRTEIALYLAAVTRPELAPLSHRWFTGLVDVLATLTDRRTATVMAVFVDGACMHAALQDEPLDLSLVEDLTRSLMLSAPTAPVPEEGKP